MNITNFIEEKRKKGIKDEEILKEIIEKSSNKKVEKGNALKNINPNHSFLKEKTLLFANVIGLALRGTEEDFTENGINLLTKKMRKEGDLKKGYKSLLFFSFLFFLAAVALITIVLLWYFNLR